MADDSRTLRYIGYYRNHRVKFLHDDAEEKPWRFVFEDGIHAGSTSEARRLSNDQPQPDIDSAKSVALKLARELYGGFAEEKWDEWLDLSEEI